MSQPTPEARDNAPLLSVVIPAYNEERRIGPTLAAIGDYLTSAGFPFEVLVVNDGSRDATVEVARKAWPAARIVENDRNRGKGYTVRHGVHEARGEFILFTDADLSTPIEEFDRFLPLLRGGADMVIGSRALAGSKIEVHQNWLRESAGRVFNWLLRRITGLPFHDTQCGFKAFRAEAAREVFARQSIEGWGFDVELITIALRRGYTVKETPVRWINSADSRLRIWRDAPRMLGELLKVRWNDWRGRYGRGPGP